jgi:polyisoprenoid-binding protein YceI
VRFALLMILLFAPTLTAQAAEYTIDPARSVFAVLTHKAGIGSAVAHDHLIVAPAPVEKFDYVASAPEKTTIEVRIDVASLQVDPPAQRAAWAPLMKRIGILSADLPPVADGDRAKIREAMLGADQLDAANHPEIRAELAVLARAPALEATCLKLKLGLTIRDKKVERLLEACTRGGDTLEIGIVRAFRFSDFGIEPYSALLGAIRNDDEFHVFVQIVANQNP